MRFSPRVVYCALLLLGIANYPAFAGQSSADNHFLFRLPRAAGYIIDESDVQQAAIAGTATDWLKAWPDDGSTNFVQLGNRVVLQLEPGTDLSQLLAGHPLTLSRTVTANIFILQAPDAWTAAREAHRLAQLPGVTASYPVVKRQAGLNSQYAPAPNDQYYIFQWYLEHRNADGSSAGVDLNVRAAWPFTQGQGVTVAVADNGVELIHPDLTNRAAGGPHFNFTDGTTNATPFGGSSAWAHGTECAGLVAAEAYNDIGMAGVAPAANLASWVIFDTNQLIATDEQLMDMYQYNSNTVSVQNHSWIAAGPTQQGPGVLEQIGIANAITHGRFGRGSIIVRSAGNDRATGVNADDDGYPSDPRVIAVAAVRIDGRVASFSDPGACVLVGAPSGDVDQNGLFTTDLVGTRGRNQFSFGPPNQSLSDYVFNGLGFNGTSASAPLIAGVTALILSANTNLTYRDVQQILILSSRHFDFADPDVVTNGAGFIVSHNLGFGIPDAAAAVNLARAWSNRPPQTFVTFTATNSAAIPDDGLRLLVTGTNVPANIASIHTVPDVGPHADNPTPLVPLVDVGTGTNISGSLTNCGALIRRGGGTFSDVITRAAKAGAVFAVIYNFDSTNSVAGACPGGDTLCPMGATDFVPIPAVFIGQTDGQNLQNYLQQNTNALAQLRLAGTNYNFNVTNTLICEQVAVRLQTDHPVRGDLRITLVSPSGTRSVLQRYNLDTSPGPVDWIYYSTHHFFESSAGNWRLEVSDESAGFTGNVLGAALTIFGVPIKDTDHDGLDDDWEMAKFGSLAYGPKDDPDKDGNSNAREQLMATNPILADVPFKLDLSTWNPGISRLSWPGSTNYHYEVWTGTNVTSLNLFTNLPGRFPETEWFTPNNVSPQQFFRVHAVQNP